MEVTPQLFPAVEPRRCHLSVHWGRDFRTEQLVRRGELVEHDMFWKQKSPIGEEFIFSSMLRSLTHSRCLGSLAFQIVAKIDCGETRSSYEHADLAIPESKRIGGSTNDSFEETKEGITELDEDQPLAPRAWGVMRSRCLLLLATRSSPAHQVRISST